MANAIPFNCFPEDLGKGVHDLATDTLRVYLTDEAPDVVNDTAYGNPADLATGGGYVAGGLSIGPNTFGQVGGVATLAPGTDLSFTATTGFGPFRYAVLYNDTAPGKNLICYWDAGAEVNVAAAKDFTVDFGAELLSYQFT